MKTVIKVYKSNCKPCQDLSEVLDEVKKDTEFKLEEYNIEATEFKERKIAKGHLMKWGTTNIPLVLFQDDNGEVYAAHYYEHGAATVETIKNKLNGIT